MPEVEKDGLSLIHTGKYIIIMLLLPPYDEVCPIQYEPDDPFAFCKNKRWQRASSSPSCGARTGRYEPTSN